MGFFWCLTPEQRQHRVESLKRARWARTRRVLLRSLKSELREVELREVDNEFVTDARSPLERLRDSARKFTISRRISQLTAEEAEKPRGSSPRADE